MFATFEDYTGKYSGNAIQRDDWNRLESRAAAFIDQLTYGRLSEMETIPEEAILAVCAVAEVVQKEIAASGEALSHAGISHFENDGYTETFKTGGDVRKEFAEAKREAAGVFLPLSHPLRYAGVS